VVLGDVGVEGSASVWCWGAGDWRGDGCRECKVDKDVDVDVEEVVEVRVVWWRILKMRHGGRVL